MNIEARTFLIFITLLISTMAGAQVQQSTLLKEPEKVQKSNSSTNTNLRILPPNSVFNFKRLVAKSGWNKNRVPIKVLHFTLKDNESVKGVTLENEQERPLTSEEKQTLDKQINASDLDNDFNVDYSVRNGRDKKTLVISVEAIRRNGNSFQALESFTVDFKKIKQTPNNAYLKANFATSSALRPGSGSWYKIGVTKTGVFKLSYSFFESMGADPETINPQNINIYGYGTGMLPEDNSIPRPDDLVKNNIKVVGEADGDFSSSDYVLFYAVGPDTWQIKNGRYKHVRHAYEDTSYYFVNVQSGNTPGRLGNAQLSSGSPTQTLSSAASYTFYDKDINQLSKSGKIWVDEVFDINLSQTNSFDLKDLITSQPVTLQTSFVHDSKIGSNSMNMSINGNPVFTEGLGVISGSHQVAGKVSKTTTYNASSQNLDVQFTFNRNSASDRAWLNYIEIIYRRNLNGSGRSYFSFRDTSGIGAGNIVEYNLTGMNGTKKIWEITNPRKVKKVNGNLSGANYTFKFNADSLRNFALVDVNGSFEEPHFVGTVAHQNIHGLSYADYLIVTPAKFKTQAERLANLHRDEYGSKVHVVEIDKIYNEFSSGMVDPTAVKWFAKMFYDRANGNPAQMPKHLMLFGDGSYDHKDRIEDNNDFLPTYQSDKTFFLSSSFTTDDYFGLLDDNEGIAEGDLMDIGVGRSVVSSKEQAKEMVDKIEHYMKDGSNLFAEQEDASCSIFENDNTNTFGAWKNRMTIIADDEDGDAFVKGAEKMRDVVRNVYPEIDQSTIYMDAFNQEVSTVGPRFPEAENAINQTIKKGVNVINYVGHGGETGLSEERVVNIEMINSWSNINKLNLFVSATCEFTRFDDPERESAGEKVYLNPKGGSIALLTTTRLVYIGINEALNIEFYRNVFDEEDGHTLSFGEIMRRTKNGVSGVSSNFRNFTLIGDPALRIKLPQYNTQADKINNIDLQVSQDTIKALQKVNVKGHVADENGNKLTGFNGLVYPTVYDKKNQLATLGQDIGSTVVNFKEWKSVIYRGKASVKGGDFEFEFIVPKDIDLNKGKGRISFYADDEKVDAHGYTQDFYVGGIDTTAPDDVTGPNIQVYMNDFNFVSGGTTNSTPNLIARVSDEHGINTVGNGIGHDITAVIDQNTSDPIVLNNFYEADTNSYKSGVIQYPMSELEEGNHTLTLKVWDVYNNSSTESINFVVADDEEIAIDHVLNYPNPFTTHTEFFFEHNQNCRMLKTQIQIFTVSGKLVKTIQRDVQTKGFRSEGIPWDGRDDFGDKIGRGVYVYRLAVSTEDGKTVDKYEKLVILN